MDDSLAPNGVTATKQSRAIRVKKHLSREIEKPWTDLVLIVSCFISGLVDSAVFNVWSCFVSMQTGNTVYVGLGVSGQPESQPYRWAKSGTAILSFCVGTYIFSRLARLLGPLKRRTMGGSFLLQGILCFVSGVLVISGVLPPDAGNQLPGNCIVLLPLAMLSFQSAGQIVASRMLAFNELPTVVLTSTYCDLMFDPTLITAPLKENSKRNRRVVSVVALILGAALGGFLTQDGSIANALWIAGSVKVAIAVTWVFWRAEGSIFLE